MKDGWKSSLSLWHTPRPHKEIHGCGKRRPTPQPRQKWSLKDENRQLAQPTTWHDHTSPATFYQEKPLVKLCYIWWIWVALLTCEQTDIWPITQTHSRPTHGPWHPRTDSTRLLFYGVVQIKVRDVKLEEIFVVCQINENVILGMPFFARQDC